MEFLSEQVFGITVRTLIIAFIGGVTPTLVWLWFWLQENRRAPEPTGLIILTFIMGMLAVVLVLPIQEFIATFSLPEIKLITLWASAEELVKYAVVAVAVLGLKSVNKPIDYAIYMITGALGFAALENTLFLINPIELQDTTVGLLTGNLRFLGSTVLHAAASAIVGIGLGLAFKKSKLRRFVYFVIGMITAMAVHSIFNYLLIVNSRSVFIPFAFVWVITLIVILAFEQLRLMEKHLLKNQSLE